MNYQPVCHHGDTFCHAVNIWRGLLPLRAAEPPPKLADNEKISSRVRQRTGPVNSIHSGRSDAPFPAPAPINPSIHQSNNPASSIHQSINPSALNHQLLTINRSVETQHFKGFQEFSRVFRN